MFNVGAFEFCTMLSNGAWRAVAMLCSVLAVAALESHNSCLREFCKHRVEADPAALLENGKRKYIQP
jgi:hypothetical protein